MSGMQSRAIRHVLLGPYDHEAWKRETGNRYSAYIRQSGRSRCMRESPDSHAFPGVDDEERQVMRNSRTGREKPFLVNSCTRKKERANKWQANRAGFEYQSRTRVTFDRGMHFIAGSCIECYFISLFRSRSKQRVSGRRPRKLS